VSFPFRCPCGLILKVKEDRIGQTIRCPACGRTSVASLPPAAPAPPAEAVFRQPTVIAPSPAAPLSAEEQPRPAGNPWTAVVLGVFLLAILGGAVAGGWWLVSRSPKEQAKVDPPPQDKPTEEVLAGSTMTGAEIYRRTLKSMVWLATPDEVAGLGSGCLVDSTERLVLTSASTVGGRKSVLVFFPEHDHQKPLAAPAAYQRDSKKLGIGAQVVLTHPAFDLVLLKLDRLPPHVYPLPLVSRSVTPGETLYAFGSTAVKPESDTDGLWQSSKGAVAQVKQYTDPPPPDGAGIAAQVVMMQSPANIGDAGGPVVTNRAALAAVVSNAAKNLFIDVREIRTVLHDHFRSLGKTWVDRAPASVPDDADLPKLIESLNSSKGDERIRVVRAMAEMGHDAQAAIPALLQAWRKPDAVLGKQVADALAKIGPPSSDDCGVLNDAFKDDRREARMYAARSLLRLGPAGQKALPGLLAGCSDSDQEVRLTCLQALTRVSDTGNKEVLGELVKALRDPAASVRKQAARSLKQAGRKAWTDALPALLAALADSDDSVADEVESTLNALGPARPEDVTALAKALKNSSSRVRSFAAWQVGFLGPKALSARSALADAVNDDHRPVRLGAIDALRQMGPEAAPALAPLLKALRDPEMQVRIHAAAALGAIGRERGVYPGLLAALEDPQDEVRTAVDAALHRLGSPNSGDADALVRSLDSDQALVRAHAARALGKLGRGGKSAVGQLTKALEDRSVRVRIAAARALGDIGPDAAGAVPTLVKMLDETVVPSPEDRIERTPATSGSSRTRDLVKSAAWISVDRGLSALGFGSGWVVDTSERLVMTSYHVIQEARTITVFFPSEKGGKLMTSPGDYLDGAGRLGVVASAVSTDPGRDLALLQLPRLPADVQALSLADKSAVAKQEVLAIINSTDGKTGQLWRQVHGPVRGTGHKDLALAGRQRVSVDVIEAPALSNPGDSGGPVVNEQMELVGVKWSLDTGAAAGKLLDKIRAEDKKALEAALPATPLPAGNGTCIDRADVKAFLDGYGKVGGAPLARQEKRLGRIAPTQSNFRIAVANALEQIGVPDEKSILTAIRLALRDRDAAVRSAVAGTAARMGAKAAPAALDLAVLCKDPATRRAGEDALVKIGRPAVRPLSRHLEDTDRELVLAIIRVLARMGPDAKEAITPLQRCRTWFEKDKEIKKAALDAIALINVEE
jgi:HEAT repeat protein